MAISKGQFKAANARGAAAIARGPIARAARYDSRRGLIVIALEGGTVALLVSIDSSAINFTPQAYIPHIV